MSPVLTIELKLLWQSDRPILITGSIKDILSGVGGDYLVLTRLIHRRDSDLIIFFINR